jgi:SAM-dependent methyltransferase
VSGSEHPLVIGLPWDTLPRTAKYERMIVRRQKILGHLDSYRNELAVLEQLLGQYARPDERVLEVACGMGFLLLELSARGWTRLVGLEIDPALATLTADAAARFALPIAPLVGDACRIPVADRSCGLVLSHSFFEHVYDVDLALSEQVRVLKPGGVLLIFDGNLMNPRVLLDLLVFYPLRTRGRHGGLRWLFTKGKVHRNLYGYLPLGRDEDAKTPRWWARRIRREPGLELIDAGSGGTYRHPSWPRLAQSMVGSCVIVARKR